ncbi:3',5'-cyclic AMP phosphodiesterase CpdA [Variovorax sp. TBS-050B]|jgi:3',5'-cyclic AMP phosphodiesterase CpdA|uniref:metallophosphoesterase family protein n=1 Tax=Variovorax sp. TBS-050B TaxID=2940551 RepID=UPI002473967F|nr:metallophosphoesterase [Variovorax sp. TBS-050B]MDH6591521.1 3',5'-cyclic AMP phosphodiesterase CpdA [Variovorax sp. TBS-050B]
MSCLLQISDPHFGTEQPEVLAALERFARELAPAVVVLSGDITQRATRRQFAAARAFVDRLPAPVVAIPGNHDIPLFQLGARLLTPYGRYADAFGAELEPVFESPEWLVIAVNTTRWYRHEDGEVSPAQIDRVADRLARAAPGQLRVVVTHQPVLVTRPEDLHNRLHGHEAALARWCAAGVDLILGGHIHLPFVRSLDEACASCPPTAWAVQAGTAVSSRVRGGQPNSVNVLRAAGPADARGCEAERWDHSAVEGAFVRARSWRLALAGG